MIPPVSMSSLFGFFLIPMGMLIWLKGIRTTVGSMPDSLANRVMLVETARTKFISLGLGLFVGIMCGIFGAGGGGGIFVILLFVLHYPIHLAVGTSSFIMMITAASGTGGYVLHGNINIYAALIASGPTVLTAWSGAWIANRVSEITLGRIIGAILTGLGITMITIQYLA